VITSGRLPGRGGLFERNAVPLDEVEEFFGRSRRDRVDVFALCAVDRDPEGKGTGCELLTVGAVACKPEPGLFRNLVADMPAAAASNQSFSLLTPIRVTGDSRTAMMCVTSLTGEHLGRLVLFGRLAQGAIGYRRSGNRSREASVEGKVRDSGRQLSLSNTVTDCAMKMRRELIQPPQAN
jgi:hypothetical protein